jgi:hypothetical protein
MAIDSIPLNDLDKVVEAKRQLFDSVRRTCWFFYLFSFSMILVSATNATLDLRAHYLKEQARLADPNAERHWNSREEGVHSVIYVFNSIQMIAAVIFSIWGSVLIVLCRIAQRAPPTPGKETKEFLSTIGSLRGMCRFLPFMLLVVIVLALFANIFFRTLGCLHGDGEATESWTN